VLLTVGSLRDVDGQYDAQTEHRAGGQVDEQVTLKLLVVDGVNSALHSELVITARTDHNQQLPQF